MKTLISAIIWTFSFLSGPDISSQNTSPIITRNRAGSGIQRMDTGGIIRLDGALATAESFHHRWDSLSEFATPELPVQLNNQLKLKTLDADKISVYPNPFTSSTSIVYFLASRARVTLGIYDSTGKEWVFLNKGRQGPGLHNTTFIRGDLQNGVYNFKLTLQFRNNKEVRSGTLVIQ
jgi:hypothetical protein